MEVGRASFSSLYPFVLVCSFLATLQHVELPHPRIKLVPPAVDAWFLNHWTTQGSPWFTL